MYASNAITEDQRQHVGIGGNYHTTEYVAVGQKYVTTERDKFKLAAVRTSIHGTAKRWITTVDHLINVLRLRRSKKNVKKFFTMQLISRNKQYIITAEGRDAKCVLMSFLK